MLCCLKVPSNLSGSLILMTATFVLVFKRRVFPPFSFTLLSCVAWPSIDNWGGSCCLLVTGTLIYVVSPSAISTELLQEHQLPYWGSCVWEDFPHLWDTCRACNGWAAVYWSFWGIFPFVWEGGGRQEFLVLCENSYPRYLQSSRNLSSVSSCALIHLCELCCYYTKYFPRRMICAAVMFQCMINSLFWS